MATDGLKPLLLVAAAMALLGPVAAIKLVDLVREKGGSLARGPAHISVLVSRNDEDPHSLNGDHVAEYKLGDKVLLICTIEGYPEELVNLSWWEGQRSLRHIRKYAQFARSSSTSLYGLTLQDSGRTFTCRADDSTQTKAVTLQVDFSSRGDADEVSADWRLQIVVNHDVALKGDGLLLYGPRDNLSLACLMQGSGVKRVSWWEGKEELVPSTESLKEHASSSTLRLRHLATADNGRRLSCRVDDSTLQLTVTLLQNRDFNFSPKEKNERTSTVHIFGSTTLTSKEVNTTTIIEIWIGIFVFIAVGLCLAKLCKKRSPTPSSNTSLSSNKGKQPKRSPVKGTTTPALMQE